MESKPRKLNDAYIAPLDKPATLWWCNWATDDQGTFCAEEKQTLSVSELSAWREHQQSIRRQREAECARRHKENESQSWQAMQAWLLGLRRRGMTVLLIHHAGKSGDQRQGGHYGYGHQPPQTQGIRNGRRRAL